MKTNARINTPTEGYMALARAIVLQAAHDARQGDIDAGLYLTLEGADLADTVNLDPAAARRFVSTRFGWPPWAIQPLGLS